MTVLRTVLHGSRDHFTRELLAVDPYMQAHPAPDPTQPYDCAWTDAKAVAMAVMLLLAIVFLSSVLPVASR